MDVGVEKKEDGVADADADADANSDLLGIGLKPRRTDSGLLLMHRRSAERKVVATTFPRESIGGRDDRDVNIDGFGVRVRIGIVGTRPQIAAAGVSVGVFRVGGGGGGRGGGGIGRGYPPSHSYDRCDPRGCGSPGQVRLYPPHLVIVVVVVVVVVVVAQMRQ